MSMIDAASALSLRRYRWEVEQVEIDARAGLETLYARRPARES